jgi:predicted RNA-binding protein with PUA-like domain
VTLAAASIWLFQANPLRKLEAYTQTHFRREFAEGPIQSWGCRQHWREVKEGDVAIVFFTGRERNGGIYGIGEVVKEAGGPGDDVLFGLFPKTTRYLIQHHLSYEDLAEVNLPNLRMRKQTVYRITPEQWEKISRLIHARRPALSAELIF